MAGLDPVRVGPLVAPLLGLAVDGRPGCGRSSTRLALRTETLKALVDWLSHFARTTPSLLLVEDLHWADPTTVDLLGLLVEGPPGVMILIPVGTA